MVAFDGVQWVVALSPVVIAAFGWIVAVQVKRLDQKNDIQHADNKEVLLRIEKKVETVGTRLDEHIDWHAHNHDRRGIA